MTDFDTDFMSEDGDGEKSRRWSFADVMRKMYDEERTGILAVSSPKVTWDVHLRKGQIVRVDVVGEQLWLLGDIFEASGTLSARQIVKTEKIARKRGLSFEEVLVAKGFVTGEALARAHDLQVQECILPLFRRVGITCRFRFEPPNPRPGSKPLPIAFLLNEAKRRNKIWPLLSERIPGLDSVYERVRGTAKSVLLGPVSSGDYGSGVRSLTEVVDGQGGISGSERLVYFHMDGRTSVTALALKTTLGEYETALATTRLLGQGRIVLAAETEEVRAKRPGVILPLFFHIFFYGMLGLFVTLLFLWASGGWVDVIFSVDEPQMKEIRTQNEEHRVVRALSVFELEKGVYPQSLEELVTDGLLEPGEAEKLGEHLIYRASSAGDRYDLVAAKFYMESEGN